MTWPRVRLKYLATTVAGGTPPVDEPTFWTDDNGGVPWVTIGDMSGRRRVFATQRRVTVAGIKAARLPIGEPGTLLMSMYASLGHTAFLETRGSWNQAILGISPSRGVDKRFLKYALESLQPHLWEFARSNTQPNLNAGQVLNLLVPSPTLGQQRRIADFLDAETARIDKLANAVRRTLKTLSEHRAAGIFRHVSGSRYADRKPVSLGWLSSIPRHWQCVRLGLVARMGSGHTPSRARPDWWTDCSIPWITTGDVGQVRNDRREEVHKTREMISEAGLANSAAELHPAGTVVLCRTASAGYSAVMAREMATSQDFVTWTCGPRLDPYYLLWCLRAMRQDLLGRLAMGSTHKTIYVPDLQMLRIPLPPVAEQREIVARIRADNERIDRLSDKLSHLLDLLTERRNTLIADAVTGAIDVSHNAHT